MGGLGSGTGIRDDARRRLWPDDAYVLNVAGDGMRDEGISDGDLLVVDRSLKAETGDVVVAAVDGELTVGRLSNGDGGPILRANCMGHRGFMPRSGCDLVVWGVALGCYHPLRPPARHDRACRPRRGP